eukprot:TCALIF_05062-PA protein Name:"Similar to RPS6KC1 Ribosomal protein S6 kinase delta-1 (Homo sapiens)" AED:0.04 eAED:0.04 QI:0/0/0/1/1/1/2/0/608
MKARRTCSLDQEWVRTFEVGPPERYQGHTLYEVTSKLYPVGFPEASTQITTQKRFSEFQKLHLALQQIHKNLYLKDPFPVLPKASYFHRFDEQVLLERRRHAVELLEFAALHPQLYNSQVFVQFFIIDENDEGGSDESSEWSRNASPFEDAPPKKAQTRQAQLNLSRVVNLRQDGNVMDASSMATALGHDPTPTLVPCAVNAQKSPAVTPTTPEEEMKNLPDYLSEAAEDVSRAVHFEIEENFEESVVCYRNAIGTLLSSVQQDRCLKRQASVKRRIAQYISKAESLVEQRNKRDSSSRMRMRMPMMMSTTGTGSSSSPANFDFMSDCADEEGEDALDVPKSPSTTQMLLNSQTLLANIDSKLEGDTSTAERVIARLDKLESTIYTHMEGRTFTPNSPFRTRKLTTPLNIRPISRNSNDLGSSDSEPLMSPESPYRSLPLFRTYNFRGPLPIHIIRLWASQLCQVLMSLHARGILVKDLNPRNLLLASNGDLCLTYQCEWVSIDRSIDVMAQQCWYTAPEVQDIQPLGPACDWWSVGVILYEITSGQYFVESYPCGLRLQPPVEFSVSIDPQLVDLITGLLQRDPSQRFSREDIQKHPFFAEIHWRMV